MMVTMRILFAEDEPTILEYVGKGLEEAGYAVDLVPDGGDALLAAEAIDYDLLILDVAMPGMNGIEVCRRLRAAGRRDPAILFLSARDTTEDRVRGLDAGAEDYLVKPFAFAELLARVRALLRRGGGGSAVLSTCGIELDPASRVVTRDGCPLDLTAKEFALLEYLVRNPGRVVTREMLIDHIWNAEIEGESNFVDVLVYALRKKVDAPFGRPLIRTVRGAGYRFDASVP
jgi:two-component system OmpR family response regulator